VNAIGDKKDVQFAGKDLRSFRTSPNNLHGASYDELDSSPSSPMMSSTSTSSSSISTSCSVERTEPWDFLISHPFCHYISSLRAGMRALKLK